ncbi:hypothetical protein [Flavobacterium frigoris]|uniref:Uncharacterized protein n=1 Tax=Flavobacterium frigoris TaxID=229204 RepID=A0A1H9RU14_FLAFI|nr:hypothetical protein [Flavobacterium frigoris]SER76292.1 hypothetical protein SAMN05444355_1253 [Flavobacterium frigoris]
MDENISNAILNLMQNVVDKLDDLDQKLRDNGSSKLPDYVQKNNDELKNLVVKIQNDQSKLIKDNLDFESKIIKYFESRENPPSTSNHVEYSLFGRESYLKPKALLVSLLCFATLWSSFKYLPSYYMERSNLKKEKENYQFFYNYVNLNQFINSKNTMASDLLQKTKNKDSTVINDYNALLSTYEKEMKKQQLKEELKSLEKK